jgi:ribosomal RNA-processing protein 1
MQNLPDKKTRDKAIRSLRKFLAAGNVMSEIELIKLWKGLFYCKSIQDFVIYDIHLVV